MSEIVSSSDMCDIATKALKFYVLFYLDTVNSEFKFHQTRKLEWSYLCVCIYTAIAYKHGCSYLRYERYLTQSIFALVLPHYPGGKAGVLFMLSLSNHTITSDVKIGTP